MWIFYSTLRVGCDEANRTVKLIHTLMYAMWILVTKGENSMAMSEDGCEKTLDRARLAISLKQSSHFV